MAIPLLRRRWVQCLLPLLIAGAVVASIAWYKLLREVDQPPFADEAERFKYGSIGAEAARGIPYWIWVVLPRLFPEYLPGPGGYQAFGLVWEEGHEIPVGFSKKTVGFPRIANNCAICHVGTWRPAADAPPRLVIGAPAHTSNLQGLIRFLYTAAGDPRFNADNLLAAISRETHLSALDRLLYRYVIIPAAKKEMMRQEDLFRWMDRPGWPQWGPGRDDPMNLTKYFMTSMPVDNTTGQADFPSIWNLKVRKGEGLYLNWSCDTPAVRSVLVDSALGLGAAPDERNPLDQLNWSVKRRAWFVQRMADLDAFLSELPPPPYPFPINTELAKRGKPIYDQHCAVCHTVGAPRTNRPIPPNEIGTDRERLDTWSQAAADEANRRVREMGIDRPNMVRIEAYQSPPLDGLWMRAPYLHNGSVPNLKELLDPVASRSTSFYRGYDVYNPAQIGFVIEGPEAERLGWRHDITVRGDSNEGHTYGVDLPEGDKRALLEYLKSL